MVTLEERREIAELASRMSGELGLESLPEADQQAIAEALGRLTPPRKEVGVITDKPPFITRMAWWL
jgi:hypothetical protein